jgi:DNA-directed RNA polymerase specialized sigma24 family protein
MKRVWLADDVYENLQALSASRRINAVLREILGLSVRKYHSRPRVKSEAVRRGIAKAKRKGKVMGRPRVPEYVREQIRSAKKDGYKIYDIGAYFSVSMSTVKRILRER